MIRRIAKTSVGSLGEMAPKACTTASFHSGPPAFRRSASGGGGAIAPFVGGDLARALPTDLFRLFDDFDVFPSMSSMGTVGRLGMPMDVKETKEAYEVTLDLPGVKKEDIHLSLRNRELTISADKEAVKKEEGANYHRLERSRGHISRTLALPEDADDGMINAEHRDGVLLLSIKKHEGAAHANEKQIEIK